MTNSPTLDAIVAVMAEITAVAKDRTNQQQGYAFRGADDVVTAVAPAFRRHGLVALPRVDSWSLDRIPTGKFDTQMWRCALVVTYTFRTAGDPDGVTATVFAEAADSADKAGAKAMTVAFRTVLLQVLALPPADSDEVTAAMSRKLMTLFGAAGYGKDREGRLGFASAVVGREIESTKDMTASEWAQVVAALESGIAEEKPEQPYEDEPTS